MTSQSPNTTDMALAKAKNVFVLIPGAWHPVDYLEPVRDYLREMGYDSIAVGHQTLDLVNPGSSVFDDAAKVEKVVKELLDAGKNVIVVMHSFGGAIGSQAIGHLLSTTKSLPPDDTERSQMGKVLRLVYVAAVIPKEGETTEDLSKLMRSEAINPVKESMPIQFIDGKMVCKEEAKEMFYHDLAESDRNKYYNLLQAAPATGKPDAPTHFGWKYVPSTYVCAMRDRILSWKAQDYMWNRTNGALWLHTVPQGSSADGTSTNSSTASSENLLRQRPSRSPGFLAVETIDSDHCSMFILRKHVELLGSILIEIVEPERRNVRRPHVVKKIEAE